MSPSWATPKPSAVASAASCGAIPHALASTSPGKLALPTACAKKARRRSTIQLPSTPAGIASRSISSSARCTYGAARSIRVPGVQELAPPVRPSTMAAVLAAIEPA